jgi:hypothetical protein
MVAGRAVRRGERNRQAETGAPRRRRCGRCAEEERCLKLEVATGAEAVRWALDFRSRDFICLRLDEWSSEKKLSRLQIMVAMKCFADFYVILCLMSRIFIMIN